MKHALRELDEDWDLTELGQRLNRFNILDALGVVRTEIRHSNALAWLLDPKASHGQGVLFLNAMLVDLAARGDVPHLQIAAAGVRVRREHHHIDVLVDCDSPRFALAIEYKIDTSEHSSQLRRYREVVERLFPEHTHVYVYLTLSEEEPSDDAWMVYTFSDLHRVLCKVVRENRQLFAPDLAMFLDHYLTSIGSFLMIDEANDELCRSIYTKHGRAINAIWGYVRRTRMRIDPIAEAVAETGRWVVATTAPSWFGLYPVEWTPEVMPRRRNEEGMELPWLTCELSRNGSDSLRFGVGVGQSVDADPKLREAVIRAAREAAIGLGLLSDGRRFDRNWERVIRYALIPVLTTEGDPLSVDELIRKTISFLDDIHPKLLPFAQFVSPVVTEWRSGLAR